MVIFFPVILKELFSSGKKYRWFKPDRCPRCGGCRLWGHGYISACFDGYRQLFTLKRYRCPDCRCVIRLRPEGYFMRFQASVAVIRSSIVSKVCRNKWLSGIGRSRQNHWFGSLRRNIKAYLTDAWNQGIIKGFDYLCRAGRTPVSRAV